jgi:GT2 family glycosyltransferase
MSPRVSVVVPTFGRPDLLGRCLVALDRQTLPRGDYEVVVVADGPDERTRAAVAALGGVFRFVALPTRRGPAAARNAGLHAARAPIVAFTDDDTVPDADWLAAGLAAFAAHECAAVTGRVVMPLASVPTDYERDAARLSDSEFVTANCFVRVEALRDIGGFDERFTLPWREDSDLHFALLASGAQVVAASRAVVVHPVRPARWGVSIAQQRKVLFDALLFKKHPRLYRERIRRHIRADYYAMVAALLVAVAGALAGSTVVALAAGAAWIVSTAIFCARRLAGTRRDFAHVTEMLATSIVIPPLAVFWRIVGAARFRVVFL